MSHNELLQEEREGLDIQSDEGSDEGKKGRIWRAIIYPDSCGGGWVETGEFDDEGYPTDDLTELFIRLEERLATEVCCSPIHFRDLKKDGTPEKKHLHIIMTYNGPKTYEQVLQSVSVFGCRIVKISQNLPREERYLAHMDTINPRKYKYPIEKVTCLNGYVCKYIAEKKEQSDFVALIDIIEDNGIVLFPDFGFTVAHEHPDLIRCMNKYQAFFNNYCTGRERLVNRELRRNAVNSEKGLTPLMSSYKSYRVRFGGRS